MTANAVQIDQAEQGSPDPALLWGARERVLLIDDDPIQLQIAGATLGGHEYDVTTAVDGWEGIQILKKQDFALVVVDLDMPRLDGFGFIAEARKLKKCEHLPIIVVSGRQDVISIDRAFEAGASSFMDKPVNWNLFGRHVRYVLRNAKSQDNLRTLVVKTQKEQAVGNHLFESVIKRAESWVQSISATSKKINLIIRGTEDARELPAVLQELARLSDDARIKLQARLYDQKVLAGENQPDFHLVDHQQIVKPLLDNHADLARAKNVSLETGKTDAFATEISISCDPKLLQAALGKLVENAIAAAPAGSTIKIWCGDGSQGEFQYTVCDRGQGFSNVQADAILHPARHQSSLRGGVGLMVAERIAHLHDGRLHFAKAKEGGTKASLILPKIRVTRHVA